MGYGVFACQFEMAFLHGGLAVRVKTAKCVKVGFLFVSLAVTVHV